MKYTKIVNGHRILNTKDSLLQKIMLFRGISLDSGRFTHSLESTMAHKISILYERRAIKELIKKYRLRKAVTPTKNSHTYLFNNCNDVLETIKDADYDGFVQAELEHIQEAVNLDYNGSSHIRILYTMDSYDTGYQLGRIIAEEHLHDLKECTGEDDEDDDDDDELEVEDNDIYEALSNYEVTGESDFLFDSTDKRNIPLKIRKKIETYACGAFQARYDSGYEGNGFCIFIETKSHSPKLESVLSDLFCPYSIYYFNHVTPVKGGYIILSYNEYNADGYSSEEANYIINLASMFKLMCLVYELWGKEVGWWKSFKVNESN